MIAEIISIGDELTSGQRLDTNSQWISQQLTDLGIRVVYHTTVADDLSSNVAVFQNALDRADIIVCSGGLGPTADDLTRQALAETLQVPLYRDEASLEHIRSLFSRRGRPMPERNLVQADFPQGSCPIFNPNGSAPGILLKKSINDRPRILMAFPGVPAELHEMFAETAVPELESFLGNRRRFIRHRTLRCFGLGESELEARLPDLIERGRDPQVGITASSATISLRISASGDSPDECESKMNLTEQIIRNRLGNIVFGTGHQELQHVLLDLLRERKMTLALAEVGTGGYLSHLFSDADPTGKTFVGSYVARNNHQIARFLGRTSSLNRTAPDLAERGRELFEADLTIAIDAFPDSEDDLLQVAVLSPTGIVADRKSFSGHPAIQLPRAAKQAINAARLLILESDPSD